MVIVPTVFVVGSNLKAEPFSLKMSIREDSTVWNLWSVRAYDRSYSSVKVLLGIPRMFETIAVEKLIWIIILTISNME